MTIKLIVLFSVFCLLSCTKTHEQDFNSEQNEIQSIDNIAPLSPFPYCSTDPNPIGGGAGYNQIYTPQDADIYIESYLGAVNFKNTIENAPIGSLIFIKGTLTIDLSNFFNLTGSSSILVPQGVTIASSRGLNSGALVYTSDLDYNSSVSTPKRAPLFVCKGNNIRFTGLRFKGPFQLEGERSKIRAKTCIEISNNYQGLQIDNCVFFGWPHAAVRIGRGYNNGSFVNNKIHHNYFFNNRQRALGYGVSIDSGYAKIYCNIFEKNRHDIAGTGKKGSGYEAYCNTILQGGTSHNFDMHDNSYKINGVKKHRENAAHFIYIHHNDFKDIGHSRSIDEDENEWNIKIRGRPDFQCRVENNRFAYNSPTEAVHQINEEGGYGNMLVWNNLYNQNDYLGWYVQHMWLKTHPNNFLNLPSSNDALMVTPVNPKNGKCNYTYAFNFGDYDGDGNTDVFKLENGKLYRTPLDASSYSQTTNWEYVSSTGMNMSDLRFGFFNGDNRTDIIRKSGNTIFVSWGANTSWSTLTTTGYSFQDLRFGDFDENGITDLFSTTGALWKVSYNSNTSWQTINSSGYQSNQLLLGWFNNNKKSDVFLANGTNFKVSYEGTSSWNTIGASQYLTNQLFVADFDGDNISDLISPNRKVSLSGNTTWKECNTNNFPVTAFKYGNF